MLCVEADADHCEAIYDKGNWGFSIGKFIFRVYPANFPLLVLGQYGGKTLYLHVRVELTIIANNSNEGIAYADENQFYYSDTPDSEIIKFDKMPKALKDSPDFQVLTNCMKEARKESGNDAVLREQRRCFTDYAEDF